MAPPDPTTIAPLPPAPTPAETQDADGAAPSGGLSTEAMILLFFGTIAALYLGRDVFIPLALAILMSFALGPLVTRLYRLGVPRVPAVLIVITAVTLLLGGFAALVGSQLVRLAEELPRYEDNLRAKAKLFSAGVPGGGLIDHAANVLRDMSEEIGQATQGGPAAGAGGGQPGQPTVLPGQGRPIPVEIHEPPSSPLDALETVALPLLGPVATVGIVIVFIIFVLLQREDLRDRLIRLFGMGDVHRTTEAVTDAAKRVGRYLLMQLVINVTYGLLVSAGLFLIGVPNALLWGVLGTILRFIPYLGPFLATLMPVALALAVEPGWTTAVLTVGLFVAIELVTNNVLEPWLYGSSTGLSPLAVIVAAVFWTTLWGPVGLLLSTPLTVCLVVLGRHVPQLQFLEVLLGSAPVLTPDVKFYQRLLADDPAEAEDLAEDLLDEQPLGAVFDRMILPAVLLAEQDRLRGALRPSRSRGIAAEVVGIADRLASSAMEGAAPAAGTEAATAPGRRVLCVGARNSLDHAAAVMLAHVLRLEGVAADAITAEAGLPPQAELRSYEAICLSFTNPRSWRQARRLAQRVSARFGQPGAIWLGAWGLPPGELADAKAASGMPNVVTTLAEAVAALKPAAAPAPAATPAAIAPPLAQPAVSASP